MTDLENSKVAKVSYPHGPRRILLKPLYNWLVSICLKFPSRLKLLECSTLFSLPVTSPLWLASNESFRNASYMKKIKKVNRNRTTLKAQVLLNFAPAATMLPHREVSLEEYTNPASARSPPPSLKLLHIQKAAHQSLMPLPQHGTWTGNERLVPQNWQEMNLDGINTKTPLNIRSTFWYQHNYMSKFLGLFQWPEVFKKINWKKKRFFPSGDLPVTRIGW